MLTYTIGPILSLLPPRWRADLFSGQIHWVRATVISAFLEGGGCLFALIGWYLLSIQAGVDQQMNVTVDAAKGVPGIGAAAGMGAGALALFAFHPLTWTLAFFTAEGFWRGFASLVSEESPGSFPLTAIDWLIRKIRGAAYERQVPLVVDLITRGTGKQPWDLKVQSCRPKPTWKHPLTVKFAEEYFRVERESPQDATPARPHVYLLKRVPAGEAYRGMEPYDPQSVLQHAPPRGLMGHAVDAVRDGIRLKTLPLVADEVLRGGAVQGWDLRIQSCRPKPDWTVGRTVRFEDRFYRLESLYDAQPPRPFGFELRAMPTGVPGRSVILFDPEAILYDPTYQ